MILKIVEDSMSKYHSRILRLLKARGFLEEKDILNFCVHDFKETQKFINQLLAEGFIQHQEVQVKGTSQPLLFYGVNYATWKDIVKLLLHGIRVSGQEKISFMLLH